MESEERVGGDEDKINEVIHHEVLEAAKKAEPHVRRLIREFISQL